jgi:hypothetical protein
MSCAVGIDSGKSESELYNCLLDPNNLHDNDYTHSIYSDHVESIQFLMLLLVFRKHMLYPPAKELDSAPRYIYLVVISSNRWCHEQVR